MDERGSMYIEFMVSLLLFSMMMLQVWPVSAVLREQAHHLSHKWQAYWGLKARAEKWVAGLEPDVGSIGSPVTFEFSEHEPWPGIRKGEFVASWSGKKQTEKMYLYAYKRVLPSSK